MKFIESEIDLKKCNKIVNLNYNNDNLVFGNLLINKYLGLFNNEDLISFLGFCISPMNLKFYEIFGLNTHPDHQCKGYATILLNGVINYINTPIILSCDSKLESFYNKRKYNKIYELNETCIMINENKFYI